MIKSAFTLVELIVVVTILAILATIGFVSYSGYLTGVRDTNRIASLTSISDGLELYRTKNDLPNPDDGINIQVDGATIANQGYVGVNVLQTIEYSKAGKDPKDDSYYSYYLTDDKKHYQLMAFLEEAENLETNNAIISTTSAVVNYSIRHPKVYGKRLGILTDTNNTPIQEIENSTINITNTSTGNYIAHLTDNKTISGTGSKLTSLKILANIGGNLKKNNGINYSCKHILDSGKSTGDGIYTISPDGINSVEVYCDMTLDGGGWTLLFNRKAGDLVNNIEDCGSNVNEFINGGLCGLSNNISAGVSYSLGGTTKDSLIKISQLGTDMEFMVHQLLNNVADSDDTFIINSSEDIFPDTLFPIRNIEVSSVCNLSGNCDNENVIWKYAGDYHYSNTECNRNTTTSGYGGMYGYCLNGLDSSESNIDLGGNRSTYNHVKLWNHHNGARSYQEKVFIR